ncbi:hypothetical protein NL676_001952 [Syzygium grande]|nr:hypothetical protein NL676_001952 [Syzygium grande]
MISVRQYLSKEHAMVEPVIVATHGWRWIRSMVSCVNDRHLGTDNSKEISTYVEPPPSAKQLFVAPSSPSPAMMATLTATAAAAVASSSVAIRLFRAHKPSCALRRDLVLRH